MSKTTHTEPLDASLCRTTAARVATRAQALLLPRTAGAWRACASAIGVLVLASPLVALLPGCGQKGALYIPGSDGKPLPSTTTRAASAPVAAQAPSAAVPPSAASRSAP